MSVEPGTKSMGDSAAVSLDLTGLPAPVADELRRLVATLRSNLGHSPAYQADPTGESSEQWSRRLQAWIDSHPARPCSIDDSREGIYAGRGE